MEVELESSLGNLNPEPALLMRLDADGSRVGWHRVMSVIFTRTSSTSQHSVSVREFGQRLE